MSGNVDFIQEQQAELLERQANAERVKHCCAPALVCEECGAPIPTAHRAAYLSATRCVSCQSVLEAKNEHYRRTVQVFVLRLTNVMSLPATAFSLLSTRKRERKAVKMSVRNGWRWLVIIRN